MVTCGSSTSDVVLGERWDDVGFRLCCSFRWLSGSVYVVQSTGKLVRIILFNKESGLILCS